MSNRVFTKEEKEIILNRLNQRRIWSGYFPLKSLNKDWLANYGTEELLEHEKEVKKYEQKSRGK